MHPVTFAIFYLCMDILWITMMSDRFYSPRIAAVQGGAPMTFRPLPAAAAYLLLLLTMFAVCMPLSRASTMPAWAVFGLVGFCVYGIYNCTNRAIFARYPLSMALVDTAWGFVSFATAGYVWSQI